MAEVRLHTHTKNLSGYSILKRVGGVAGDSIEISNGRLMINGQFIGITSRAKHAARQLGVDVDSFDRKKYILPEGQLFLIGETEDTFDSRYWGPIKTSQVTGVGFPLVN